MNVSYAVVQTGKRTWQVASFNTLDRVPVFSLMQERYQSDEDAIKAALAKQGEYDACDTKMLHDLEVDYDASTPRRSRHSSHCVVCGTGLPCKHGQYGFRGVQTTRDLPVRELTPEECRRLLVHAHDCSRERQRAYLFTAAPAIAEGKAGAEIYFDSAEQEQIKAWIVAEVREKTRW